MCSIENKKVPSNDISLIKIFIKDLTKDISTINFEIDGLKSKLDLLDKNTQTFLSKENYVLAKITSKQAKDLTKRIECLETASKTIEVVKRKHGIACQQLRELYFKKRYFRYLLKNQDNNVVIEKRLDDVLSKISSIQKEYFLY